MTVVNCPHGEVDLEKGCPQCIAEREERTRLADELVKKLDRESILTEPTALSLVKVQYLKTDTGELSKREYTYFTEEELPLGAIVRVQVREHAMTARVSAIDVPISEIEAFKDKVKTIPAGSKVIGVLHNKGPAPANVLAVDCLPEPIPAGAPIPETAVFAEATMALTTPDKDHEVLQLQDKIMKVKGYADIRVVATLTQAKDATNDLAIMAQLRKDIEKKRKEYVGPLNEQVKEFNAVFKTLSEPLAQADKATRDKVLAFKAEESRKIKELADIAAMKAEAAAREAALNNQPTPEPPKAVIMEPSKRVRGELGLGSVTKNKKWRVQDLTLIPESYKMLDDVKIGRVIRAGGDIPGIEAYEEDSLRVTSN